MTTLTGPFLTARATGERRRILDPLGLDAVGASIVRRCLLPGITSNLQHARYFSFMTWIVGSYEVSGTRVPWKLYRRRLEHAVRIAIKHADPGIRGLIGTDRTPLLVDAKPRSPQLIDIEAPSSFEAQYYGASFGAIGLAYRPPRSAPELTGLGRVLFTAVEQEIEAASRASTTAARKLQSAPEQLTVGDLQALSEFFSLRPLQAADLEYEPLLTAVGGLDPDGERSAGDARQRSRVFALILSILGRRGIHVSDWRTLLTAVSGPHLPADVQANFSEQIEAWRCFGERQAQRIGLGGFWSVVDEWVRREAPFAVPVDVLVQRAVDLLPTGTRSRGESPRPTADLTWGSFVDAVADEVGPSRSTRFDYSRDLMAQLEGHRAGLPMADRIDVSLRLLAVSMVSWRLEDRADNLFAYGLHSHGGEGRMSLPWFIGELGEMCAQPVAAVVRWLIERCVLDQLQRVGYAKGPGTSKVLLVREEGAVLLAREGTVVRPFAQDTNRLGAALALMEGLQLIDRPNGQFRTTAAGSDFLQALGH